MLERREILAGVAGLLAIAVFGFFRLDDDDEPFRYTLDVFEELSRRTAPSGAQMLHESRPRINRWSVQIEWQLETELEWAEYLNWLQGELWRDFKLLSRSETMLRYSRLLPGDRNLIEFRLVHTGPPLRVAVTLVTSPD